MIRPHQIVLLLILGVLLFGRRLPEVGRSLEALVDIRLLPSADPDGFERLALGLAAVREVDFLTGRYDYQLRLACRDAACLERQCSSQVRWCKAE